MSRAMLGLALGLALTIAASASSYADETLAVTSPSGDIVVEIATDELNRAVYTVRFRDETVIERSQLGMRFADHHGFDRPLAIEEPRRAAENRRWEQPWGEDRVVLEHYNELALDLVATEGPARRLTVGGESSTTALDFATRCLASRVTTTCASSRS